MSRRVNANRVPSKRNINGRDSTKRGSSSNKAVGTEYERYVATIVGVLQRADDIVTLRLEHDVQLVGASGLNHQVDVYWEYQSGKAVDRVVIECRAWRNKLSKAHVQQLHGKLADLPGCRGVLVTREGFQKGAAALAQSLGIVLKVIREPRGLDYHGFVRTIEVRQTSVWNEPEEVEFSYSAAWAAAQSDDVREFLAAPPALRLLAGLRIRDNSDGSIIEVAELFRRLPTADAPSRAHFEWPDAEIQHDDGPWLRLQAVTFQYSPQRFSMNSVCELPPDRAMVRDGITGHRRFVQNDGKVWGEPSICPSFSVGPPAEMLVAPRPLIRNEFTSGLVGEEAKR